MASAIPFFTDWARAVFQDLHQLTSRVTTFFSTVSMPAILHELKNLSAAIAAQTGATTVVERQAVTWLVEPPAEGARSGIVNVGRFPAAGNQHLLITGTVNNGANVTLRLWFGHTDATLFPSHLIFLLPRGGAFSWPIPSRPPARYMSIELLGTATNISAAVVTIHNDTTTP